MYMEKPVRKTLGYSNFAPQTPNPKMIRHNYTHHPSVSSLRPTPYLYSENIPCYPKYQHIHDSYQAPTHTLGDNRMRLASLTQENEYLRRMVEQQRTRTYQKDHRYQRKRASTESAEDQNEETSSEMMNNCKSERKNEAPKVLTLEHSQETELKGKEITQLQEQVSLCKTQIEALKLKLQQQKKVNQQKLEQVEKHLNQEKDMNNILREELLELEDTLKKRQKMLFKRDAEIESLKEVHASQKEQLEEENRQLSDLLGGLRNSLDKVGPKLQK